MITILLLITLNLSFEADVQDYRGNKLKSTTRTVVHYQIVDGTFYITSGVVTFQGEISGDKDIFLVHTTKGQRWLVSIINPKHLVITFDRQTIVIKGV